MIAPEAWPTLLIPVTFAGMMGVEALGRGPDWPRKEGWRERGLWFFLMLSAVNGLVAAATPPPWRSVRLFDGARLGVAGGAIAGYLLLSLGNAALHYSYHRWDFLWRWVHRLHHEPTGLDVGGVMIQTPLEAAANAVLFFLVTTTILGLPALPAALTAYLGAFYGMFQHFNVPTPRWLGCLIQRPEAHSFHHLRGRHEINYSDFPLWDMLCGTWSNPERFAEGALGSLDTPRGR